ncbi:MAG: mannose-1-phosphate guanylyltransferase, partial [Lachnospiraceae bacterium]|nr:mannose-1-phosphate guanylyltransferase [Lachnospiraceae bacterium]
MQIILLSGGSGKRLWPLSNEVRSKQFIKFFKKDANTYESMVQGMYASIKQTMPSANITVATSKTQVSSLRNQLSDSVNVCLEPGRRDTFPAICLAALFLKDKCGVEENEAVVVLPVDPYVDLNYFETVKEIAENVDKCTSNITLMGIKPTYPSEKYGYIVPDGKGGVKEFKEKPDLEGAKKLLSEGAYWNGGVFGFKLKYMVAKAKEMLNVSGYQDLFDNYMNATKISIDYALVEKEKSIELVEYAGDWMDVGTWKTLTHVMSDKSLGKVLMDDTCEDSYVINETDLPIIAMGLKNVIVAAGPDGVLVADRDQSSYMKPLVEKVEEPIKYADKSWGSYTVLDASGQGMTIKVELRAGNQMKYHLHEHRDEVWTVLKGEGEVTLDGVKRKVT